VHLDLQQGPAAAANDDSPARTRIFHCISDEIAEDALQQKGVAHRYGAGRVRVQREVFMLCDVFAFAAKPNQNRAEHDRRGLNVDRMNIGARWLDRWGIRASTRPRTASGGPRRFEALRTLAVTTLYCRGQEICSQGEPADHWFWIIAGSARRSVIRSDGRRQIVDLLLPDDCFGFTNGAEYDDTVEAGVPES
jgi:hypothetical protein